MASYQQSTVRCPFLLLLVAFGALALLIPIAAVAQDDLDSQLMEAAWGGQTEKVKALLAAGADAAVKIFGITALMLAAVNGHTDTAKVLLGAGADLEAKDEDGPG